jgi:hypothetical protein
MHHVCTITEEEAEAAAQGRIIAVGTRPTAAEANVGVANLG